MNSNALLVRHNLPSPVKIGSTSQEVHGLVYQNFRGGGKTPPALWVPTALPIAGATVGRFVIFPKAVNFDPRLRDS